MMTRRAATLAVAVLVALAGCGGRESDEAAARRVAADFHAALDAGDGAAACGLLTEQSAHEVEKSSSSPCAEGVLDANVSDAGQPLRSLVFGDEARVDFESDTVFVSHRTDGWRIAAVGCQPSPTEPFDCQIQGA
jgi:hypothetical protein